MDHCKIMQEMGKRARQASHLMARAGSSLKRDALMMMAEVLRQEVDGIQSANEKDVLAAKQKNLAKA